MDQIISLATYLFVGFIEMFLVTQRTAFISRDKRKAASMVVLVENVITFFVIIQLAKDVTNNLPGFTAYCIGSCSGTIFDVENLTYDKILRQVKRFTNKLSKKKTIVVYEAEAV